MKKKALQGKRMTRYQHIYIILVMPLFSVWCNDVSQPLKQLHNALNHMVLPMRGAIGQEMHQLLENPVDMARRNQEFFDNSMKSVQDQLLEKIFVPTDRDEAQQVNEDVKNIVSQRIENQQQPLVPFFECNSKKCKLSRRNSEIRNRFDERVARHITQMYNQGYTPIEYASVGSGWLLSDLRILGLALRQNPNMSINIHLMDPIYAQHNTLSTKIAFAFGSVIPVTNPNSQDYRQEAKQNIPVAQSTNVSDYSIAQIEAQSHIRQDKHRGQFDISPQPRYMLHALQHAFPNAQLKLITYTNINDYWHFVSGVFKKAGTRAKKLYAPKPHVIAAGDIQTKDNPKNIYNRMINIFNENNEYATRGIFMPNRAQDASIVEFAYTQFHEDAYPTTPQRIKKYILDSQDSIPRDHNGELFTYMPWK